MRYRTYILNIVMVALSVALGLVAAEMVYRKLEPIDQRKMLVKPMPHSGVYDAKLGWKVAPNKKWVSSRSEYSVTSQTNSHGMRYRDIGPKKGLRVAVVGDSFTWGIGVEQKDRFTDVAEKKLGVEILNFGRSGYGPVQYYLMLDEVIAFKPDIVIIAFCLSNDFGESMSNFGHNLYRPYAVLEQGKLVIKGIPVPDVRGMGHKRLPWLMHYALGRFLYLHIPALWHEWEDVPHYIFALPVQGMRGSVETKIYDSLASPAAQQSSEITRHVLLEMQRKLAAAGIRMAVYPVMTRKELDSQNTFRLLQQLLKQSKIEMIPAEKAQAEYFYPVDGHWNVDGHKKAAQEIMPAIRRYGTEKARP